MAARLGLSYATSRRLSPKRLHACVKNLSVPLSTVGLDPSRRAPPSSSSRGPSTAGRRRSSSSPSSEARRAEGGRLPPDFLRTLRARRPDLAISTNPYDLDSHGRGESHHPTSPPDAVIYPSSAEEVREILRLCCRESKSDEGREEEDGVATVEIVSVIPYGAGTSLEGHLQFLFPPENDDCDDFGGGKLVDIPSSCFTDRDDGVDSYKKARIKRTGGISIDMSRFQSIGEVGPGDSFVKVGAGVTRKTLNEALRHTGMQFMVDPGADATIGGMAACGASGTAAVKYGTMRENVLAMTAVLPPTTILSASHGDDEEAANAAAEVVRCGSNALKSSAGYNLPAIFTGSEGTLGILTDVTVKLHPIPSHVIAASCAFPDLHSAAEAVATIRMTGIPVARIELLDEISIRAFNRTLGGGEICDDGGDELRLRPMDAKPTLFLEFAGHSEAAATEDLSAARRVCANDFAGVNFASASDESTRRALWAARHRLYYSSIALRGGDDDGDEGATPQSTVLTDACVPLPHFADIITATARDVRELGVVGPCFGHAGDGNFHCILPLKRNDTKEYRDNVFKVVENLTERAINVGGSCTGEHGIGYGKKKYLKRMYGEGGVSMMEAVKRAMDPFNILNPGKIVDNDFFGGFRRG